MTKWPKTLLTGLAVGQTLFSKNIFIYNLSLYLLLHRESAFVYVRLNKHMFCGMFKNLLFPVSFLTGAVCYATECSMISGEAKKLSWTKIGSNMTMENKYVATYISGSNSIWPID